MIAGMLNVIETAKKDTTSGKMINWYVLPVICGLTEGMEPLWIGSSLHSGQFTSSASKAETSDECM